MRHGELSGGRGRRGRLTVVSAWSNLATGVSAGGAVQLGGNITAPRGGCLTVGATPVTLDLNGFDITITQPASDTVAITVPSTGSLTIEDTSAGAPGTLTATGAGWTWARCTWGSGSAASCTSCGSACADT